MKFTAADAYELSQKARAPKTLRDVLAHVKRFAKAGKTELIIRFPDQSLERAGVLDDLLVKRGFETEHYSNRQGLLYLIIKWDKPSPIDK